MRHRNLLLSSSPILPFRFAIFSKWMIATCLVLMANLTQAQPITVISNPSQPDLFAWTGSGAYSGYTGNPIVLNNTLVLEYNPTGTSDVAVVKLQLLVYNGSSYTLIPNPDNGQGVYFNAVQIIYNNKLYFIYIDVSGIQHLASFDGTAITLYPNPDAGLGYIGSPRIFNNTLYVAYSNISGVTQFGRFTGSGIALINNPDNSASGFFNNYSVVFDNKICSRYVNAAGIKQVATFDGIAWTLLPNPDNTTRGVYPSFPTVYKNKLYFQYFSAANQYQLLQYDGTNNPSLIANPQNSSANSGGFTGFPIISNDTLFFQYYNTTSVYQLAKFDGTTVSLVPNPDNSPYGFWWKPVVYNNNLYILYLSTDNIRRLALYQPASNSLFVYPNPDGGTGYWDYPIVYGSRLYMMYSNAQSKFQLSYFDGVSVKLIDNPSGIYNASLGNNGYTGAPIVWNNLLYLQFASVPYGYAGNLAYFNESVLPVRFTSFSGSLQYGRAVLQWTVANEQNSSGYEVERSRNGADFTSIGSVESQASIGTQHAYTFTDDKALTGTGYYRLKQIDNGGRFTYSSVIRLGNSLFTWQVLGSATANNCRVQLELDRTSDVAIQVLSANGSVIQTLPKGRLAAGSYSIPIDMSRAVSGWYIIKLMVADQLYTKKIIK